VKKGVGDDVCGHPGNLLFVGWEYGIAKVANRETRYASDDDPCI
jgi:hypothetical protein